MPDWISGAALLLGSIASLWAILQGRRKTQAEANGLVVQSYKLLAQDLQQQVLDLKQQVRLLKEQVRNLEEQVALLHEQKVHAEAFLTIAEAKIAAYEGRNLANGEAEE